MTYYKSGDWNVICDVCSKKIKASESRKRWDGLIVCQDDFEQRHPQDFVKSKEDKISVPFTRPLPTLIFKDVPYIFTGDTICTVSGRQAIPNEGIPHCMIPSKINSGL